MTVAELINPFRLVKNHFEKLDMEFFRACFDENIVNPRPPLILKFYYRARRLYFRIACGLLKHKWENVRTSYEYDEWEARCARCNSTDYDED